MSETDWPRVRDADGTARIVSKLQRKVRNLGWAYVFLAICFFVVELASQIYANEVQQSRAERFCLLAQQSIDASTPETPVSPGLVAGAEAVGCRLRIPPGTAIIEE